MKSINTNSDAYTQKDLPRALVEYLKDDTIFTSYIQSTMEALTTKIFSEIVSTDKASLTRNIVVDIIHDILDPQSKGVRTRELEEEYGLSKSIRKDIEDMRSSILYGKSKFFDQDLKKFGFDQKNLKHSTFVMVKIEERTFIATQVVMHVNFAEAYPKKILESNQAHMRHGSEQCLCRTR